MNELQIFNNEELGQVRVSTKNNQAMFCLSDVCKILGLTNATEVKKRLSEKGVSSIDTLTAGGQQSLLYINESNLYKVIFQSRKPEAERFTDWVTNDVLPSIRKTGMYAADELLDNPDLLIAAATKLKEERAARLQAEQKVLELKPKADFYDDVVGSKDAISIGEVAKVLGIKGLGRNNLFEMLRDKRVLQNNNQPYQAYVDRGYFRVIEQKFTTPDGETKINIKTLVYQKGLDYIRKLVS